jgi:hypothetical protein
MEIRQVEDAKSIHGGGKPGYVDILIVPLNPTRLNKKCISRRKRANPQHHPCRETPIHSPVATDSHQP